MNTNKERDEPEYDEEKVKSNVYQLSLREQSVTDNTKNVTKNCNQEIIKVQEIQE